MNQSFESEWSKIEHFMFRLFSLYLIIYILFISDFISGFGDSFPILQYINMPFSFISKAFIEFVNFLFIHKQSVESFSFLPDTFWGYIAAISFFSLSIIISLIWTKFDKSKYSSVFFKCMHLIARYYLAFILSIYGITKVFEFQFSPNSQNALFYSLPELTPHQLFWSFMGVSKSYQIFAGLLEIIPALLLLFRRTAIIGSLIAFPVLLNVLMLDIGYDTPLKLFLCHLLFITVFISAPDIKKMFNFFVLKRNETLVTVAPVIENKKLNWLRYFIKISIISGILFLELKGQLNNINEETNVPQASIVGIHKIKDYPLIPEPLVTDKNNSTVWKKFAVASCCRFNVQLMNDSIILYFIKSVTSESIQLTSKEDSSFKCTLHYVKINPDEWLFNGTLKNDSIRFISNKIDFSKSELLKDFGKTKWVY